MIIISFGTPRSGTTFIETMMAHNPYVKELGKVCNMMPYIFQTELKFDDFVFGQIQRVANIFDVVYFKLQEASYMHPLNSQTKFISMCNQLPQPIKLIRTYRSAFNVYRSMVYMKGKVRVEGRFDPIAFDGIVSMILAEYAGYLSIKDRYDIASINFDKLSDLNYLQSKLERINLDDNVIKGCIDFVDMAYGKIPVRAGILSDGDIHLTLSDKQLETLNKIDQIRKMIR